MKMVGFCKPLVKKMKMEVFPKATLKMITMVGLYERTLKPRNCNEYPQKDTQQRRTLITHEMILQHLVKTLLHTKLLHTYSFFSSSGKSSISLHQEARDDNGP
jgi:hypothetical protein